MESADYIHFVDGADANKPGADWQIDRTESLEGPDGQTVILDLLKDGRVGGVELIFYKGSEKLRLIAMVYPRVT